MNLLLYKIIKNQIHQMIKENENNNKLLNVYHQRIIINNFMDKLLK